MHRLAVGTLCAVVSLVTTTAPARAAIPDTTISTPLATVSYSVGDVAFDGPECVSAPVIWSYAKTNARQNWTTIELDINANQSGANNGVGVVLASRYWEPLSATNQSAWMKVCANDIDPTRGALVISGTLKTSDLSGAQASAPLPNGQITFTANPTSLTKPRSHLANGFPSYYEIKGDATSQTLTKGVVPAGGTPVLQIKKPHRSWVSGISAAIDSYGEYRFRIANPERYPKGTLFRVAIRDCGWCTSATSPVGRL